jgi:hypothetical protein
MALEGDRRRLMLRKGLLKLHYTLGTITDKLQVVSVTRQKRPIV